LVLDPESAGSIDQVRTKFDPLTKKVPAHVTLVFPEPAKCIDKEHIKKAPLRELPSVEEITFTNVIVHNEKYLFLLPDEDGKQKLCQWREVLMSGLPEDHTQWNDFMPHLTLGYVPRSMTAEEAVGFARTHIQLPVTLKFKDLLLEEFGEDQLSKQVDALPLNGPMPEGEPRVIESAVVEAEGIAGEMNEDAADSSTAAMAGASSEDESDDT
jgi:2'-5' RNA ligase